MFSIGIDVSKATFHAALDDALVRKFKNSTEGIAGFLAAIEALGNSPNVTTLGVESTGVYHLMLCMQLTKAGYAVMIINPLESHRFMAAQSLRQRKTDAIDAQHIRTMVRAGIGRLFVETDEVLALKALVTERDALIHMRTMAKNHREARTVRNRAVAVPIYDPSPRVMAALDAEVHMIDAHLLSYMPTTQHLLRSIPGIGTVSAAYLVAHIGDIRRFSSPEKLVAYVGLDCRVHQSGTSVKGRGLSASAEALVSARHSSTLHSWRGKPILGSGGILRRRSVKACIMLRRLTPWSASCSILSTQSGLGVLHLKPETNS